ncbi:B12-binding domain-containing protein [Acetobacterium wieringae]|uniref:cobalamin B12-binding domain-containing protein n=1 Tax=Acetobacterium wieringae TaxID=52694 RepID=UPI0026F07C40|nr:cobalamin-dependent protein [Acetobacterium wieringae]
MLDLRILTQTIGDLDEEKVIDLLDDFIADNPSELEVREAVTACQNGMALVGSLFEKGEYFVADLIFAGELLTEAVNRLKPILSESETMVSGTIVLGTVYGDLHDIGKNIFKIMSEAAGFKVVDLGIDVDPEYFVKKVQECQPEIIGMSGVLTMSIDTMKSTITALRAAGVTAKIIVGGHPVTPEIGQLIGADGYTANAAEGVKICQQWMAGDQRWGLNELVG